MRGRRDPLHTIAVVLAVAGLASPSCSARTLPGTLLGTYKVVAHSQTNSCGLASAPSPWTFLVKLSKDGAILYWSWLDGSAPVSSTVDAKSQATLTASQVLNVDGTDAGPGPCTMQRDDNIVITLGSGAPPGAFRGTLGYSFSAANGSNCSDQLSAAGGQYQALPCSVTYTVAATRE